MWIMARRPRELWILNGSFMIEPAVVDLACQTVVHRVDHAQDREDHWHQDQHPHDQDVTMLLINDRLGSLQN